jgi:hypothetical protein
MSTGQDELARPLAAYRLYHSEVIAMKKLIKKTLRCLRWEFPWCGALVLASCTMRIATQNRSHDEQK